MDVITAKEGLTLAHGDASPDPNPWQRSPVKTDGSAAQSATNAPAADAHTLHAESSSKPWASAATRFSSVFSVTQSASAPATTMGALQSHSPQSSQRERRFSYEDLFPDEDEEADAARLKELR